MFLDQISMYAGSTGQAVLNPLLVLFNSIVLFLPGLIAAIIVIIVGYIVASVIAAGVKKGLDKVQLDDWMEKHHLHDAVGSLKISYLLSKLLKWYIIIAFLIPAVALLRMGALSVLLRALIMWLPNVLSAILVFVGGLILADFAQHRINEAKRKFAQNLGSVVKVIIIIFAGLTALRELGVYVSLAEKTIMILVFGLTLAASLAIGIGFGFGLRDQAREMVKDARKKWF